MPGQGAPQHSWPPSDPPGHAHASSAMFEIARQEQPALAPKATFGLPPRQVAARPSCACACRPSYRRDAPTEFGPPHQFDATSHSAIRSDDHASAPHGRGPVRRSRGLRDMVPAVRLVPEQPRMPMLDDPPLLPIRHGSRPSRRGGFATSLFRERRHPPNGAAAGTERGPGRLTGCPLRCCVVRVVCRNRSSVCRRRAGERAVRFT